MTSGSKLFLCVDCGGTKTSAVIADDTGAVVASGQGGPSNYTDVGMSAFLRSVKVATEAALCEATGLVVTLPSPSPLLSAAWFGISGCDRPADVIALKPPLSTLLSLPVQNLTIANDTHLLASPLSAHPSANSAVVIIAGTGSNCVSFWRNEEGGLVELGRSGGWGWMLGDEGSGYYVGRTAVRHILARWDRASLNTWPDGSQEDILSEVDPISNKPTLRARVFGHFGITAPPDLFSIVYAADPPSVYNAGNPSTNAPPPSPRPTLSEVTDTPPGIVVNSASQSSQSSPDRVENKNTNVYLLERKHRLTSLTPLVFSSAFDDGDLGALAVLRTCARSLAEHIANLLVPHPPNPSARSVFAEHLPPRAEHPKAVHAGETILCFGGSLVGIKKYRDMVVDELSRVRRGLSVGNGEVEGAGDEGRGVVAGVVYVPDAAVSGAIGLAKGFAG